MFGIRVFMLMNRVQLISVYLVRCNEKVCDYDFVGCFVVKQLRCVFVIVMCNFIYLSM